MGKRGESSRETARNAILLFAADQKRHQRSEFIHELVGKRRKFAKNTVYKYMDELVNDGLLNMQPGSQEDSFKPDYSITDLGLRVVARIEVHNSIDSFSAEWLGVLKEMLSSLLTKLKSAKVEPQWLLETQGLMFVPIKRLPTPTSKKKRLFLNLVMFPLEVDAMQKVVEYLKEEQWIH